MNALKQRDPDRRTMLVQLAWLFTRLGTTAFGGPAAHIALMRDEVVRRRGWLTDREFLDLVGATNLIPGPNSTEMAIHIGRRCAGTPGLIVAGVCFIVPAVLIVGAIAWFYIRYESLPALEHVLRGIVPVVVGIVAHALWALGRSALRSLWLVLVAVISVALVLTGVNELIVLLAAAVASVLHAAPRRHRTAAALVAGASVASTPCAALASAATASASGVTLGTLFAVFFKAGALLFGSGYVLLAFLRADLVERLGWMTEQELLTAISVGQFTPGPVFTTATFIGYALGGPSAALVATLGIFLPAFVYVWLTAPILPRLRQSRVMGAVLDGVNAASLALMAVVTWQLARVAVVDVATATLAIAALVLLVTTRLNSVWLILAGAAVGMLRG